MLNEINDIKFANVKRMLNNVNDMKYANVERMLNDENILNVTFSIFDKKNLLILCIS